MRTLIRASQLHPDVSGLISYYTSGLYPNYSNLSGASGIISSISGGYLLMSLANFQSGYVNTISSLSGNIFITGESGIYTRIQNENIYIGYSGSLQNLNYTQNITGYGNVDVWKLNESTYAISGISITGANGIETSYNPFKTLLTIKGVGIGTINTLTGNINIIPSEGLQLTTSGQSILINARDAAFSGVNSLNGLKSAPLSVIGTADIDIVTNTGLNTIYVGYTGAGWGSDQFYIGSDNNNVNFIGSNNVFDSNQSCLADGDDNTYSVNTGVDSLNSYKSNYVKNNFSTFINTTGSTFTEITGSTFINGITNNKKFKHPYSVGFGGSVDNTFSTNLYMKTFLSGKQIMKTLKVPKTTYSGIYLSTGTVLFGEINYVAVRQDMTDFEASFDAKQFGIYGKKYFMAQRATNLQVDIKDESDLFGGTNKYNLFLSGGNDEKLYLWASGYSGSDPGDGLDGVHDVIFTAHLNFVNFNITPEVD